jgi:acylphosphatase
VNEPAARPVVRRCFVSGRVQRVGYRAATAARARDLGVVGYARNLADGRVEVLACGSAEAVEALVAWLWKGPVLASVADVTSEAADDTPPNGFSTA